MAKLSLSAAAKAANKSKSVISKALKDGILTGAKNVQGRYEIDLSELRRVYGPEMTENERTPQRTDEKTFMNGQKEHENSPLEPKVNPEVELAVLRARLEALEGQGGLLETLRGSAERERVRADAASDRADRAEERERGLLTDQSPKKRGWFRR